MAYKGSYLAASKILEPDDYLVSPGGEYVAYFRDNGQLGLCYAVEGTQTPDWDRCYWQSPVSPGSQPWGVMQDDGNLVFYNGPQQPDPDHPDPAYFASNTALNRTFVTVLQDDGNLVVCTGTPPGDTEEILWSALPQISASCKFMQNYRVTVPVNGGPDVLAIKNKAGAIELFTIGTGGDTYTFSPDAASETGYSQATVPTGLKAKYLAGGADGAGNVVLFASDGQALVSVAETSDPANRWGPPQSIYASGLPVADLAARNIGGVLWLLAMQKIAAGYQPAVMRWGAEPKLLANTSLYDKYVSPPPAYLHLAGSPAEPTATILDTASSPPKVFDWDLSSGKATTSSLDSAQALLGLDIATDGTGADWVVAVLQNGQVCRLTSASAQQHSWTPLWPDISYTSYSVQFQDVAAETDASGGVHVFAVAKAQAVVDGDPTKYNVLYHQPPNPPAQSQPVPIYKSNGMQLAGVGNDAGSIDLFAVSAGNLVTHLFAEEDGTNWIEERVLDPADDSAPITEYSSYATDITVFDGDQSILSDEYVDLYVSDRSRIEINGLTFFLDEHVPAHVATNGAGMLCIGQETGSLASTLLRIQLSAARVSDKAPIIVVEPYADVQETLGGASAKMLLDAQVTNDDGTTSNLLEGDYRDGTTPDSLADALQNFLGDTQHSGELDAAQRARLASRARVHMHGQRSSGPGRPSSAAERNRFWSRQAPHPGGLRQAGALTERRPCRLTFHEDGFAFERLTAAHAADLRAQKLDTLPAVSSSGLGWLSKIGDALRAVAEGIARIGEVIFDGIKATLDLIIDGITYVFDAVVQFIEDAFDMVEMIFNHVKVFFEQLYKWLAWLFDWTSIKQTKICIAYSFDQMMLFLKGAVDQLRPKVDSGFAAFKSQFAAMMDDAIGNVAQGYTVGGYDQRNTSYDADADSATSNNFFLNEFVSNGGSSGPQQTVALGASDPISALANLLTQLTAVEEASTDSFNQALAYFSDLGKQPDQFFNCAFKGMLSALKGIGLVGLDLAGNIVDALLDALSAVIDTFVQLIKQPMSIPFVSTFYKWIVKEDLTLLNLVSLAAAIPSSILYRITTGDPLFTASSGAGSSGEFTSAFTWQSMLNAAGLAPASLRAQSGPVPTITKKVAYAMAGTYLTVTIMGGVLSGIGEMKMPKWKYPLGWIPYAAIGCAFLSAVFSFPWFYADTGGGSFEDTVYMAMCFSLVGLAYFDTMGSYAFPADTVNDIRAVAFTVSGALLLAQAAWNTKDDPDGRVIAWAILQRIPWAVKFLRLNGITASTFGFSVLVLAFVDYACGVTTGVLGYLVLRERYDIAAARPGIAVDPA